MLLRAISEQQTDQAEVLDTGKPKPKSSVRKWISRSKEGHTCSPSWADYCCCSLKALECSLLAGVLLCPLDECILCGGVAQGTTLVLSQLLGPRQQRGTETQS